MSMETFELDPDDNLKEMCGKIFSTAKGLFVFICSLCDRKYSAYESFLYHLAEEHIIPKESKPDIASLNAATEMGVCNNEPQHAATEEHSGISLSQADPLAINLTAVNCDNNYFKEEILYEENSHSFSDHHQNLPLTEVDLKRNPKKLLAGKHHSKSTRRKRNTTATIEKEKKLDKAETSETPCTDTSKEPKSESGDVDVKDLPQATQTIRLKRIVEKVGEKAEQNVLDTITVTNQIRCIKCPVIFTEVDEFRDHLKGHENYVCPRCSVSYISKYKLEQHMRLPCKVFKRPLKCYLCGFIFEYQNQLRSHLVRHFHSDEYKCQKCSSSFKTDVCLQRHMESHNNDKTYKCNICGISLTRKSNMQKHMLRHSAENKKYECKECSKKFFQRNDLRQHFLLSHSKERPHLCSECGASFSILGKLNKHVRKIHSQKEKDVKCEKCSKMFFHKDNLRRHMMIHVEDRNYVCEVCNAAFKLQKVLKTHMKIHENKRAYKCELCEKSFNQGPSLVSHRKSVHNNVT